MAHIVKVTGGPGVRPYEVRWSAYDALGRRTFRKKRFRTRREADGWAREVAADVARAAGLTVPEWGRAREAVGGWAELWLAEGAARWAPTTRREYTRLWRAPGGGDVATRWAGVAVGAVRAEDVTAWGAELVGGVRGLAPHSARRRVAVLSAVLDGAVRAGVLSANPCAGARLPTDRAAGRPPHEPRFLTGAEVEAVAARCGSEVAWRGTAVRFAGWTGLRASEMAGLERADVTTWPGGGEVRVRRTARLVRGAWEFGTGKTARSRRRVAVPGWLAEELDAYLAGRPDRGEVGAAPLWPGAHGGGGGAWRGSTDWSARWEPSAFYRRHFRPACAAEGLGAVRWHDLRHTYASLCASAGVPVQQVAAWLGHESEVVTARVYSHLFAADTAGWAAVLGAGGRPGAGVGAARLALVRGGAEGVLSANESAVG